MCFDSIIQSNPHLKIGCLYQFQPARSPIYGTTRIPCYTNMLLVGFGETEVQAYAKFLIDTKILKVPSIFFSEFHNMEQE